MVTMPDPSSVNPFGRRLGRRMFHFNDIVRTEADRYDVIVMDFQRYPIVQDPRLFSDDRLHGNELGHQRVAAAMAWRLGIEGADESWAQPLPSRCPDCVAASISLGTSGGRVGTSLRGSAEAFAASRRALGSPRSVRRSSACPECSRDLLRPVSAVPDPAEGRLG